MEIILPSLICILQEHFHWNLSRTKCIAALIIALVQTKTVNLVQLAIALPGNAQKDSKYRRIQRLFKEVEFDNENIARFIANRLPSLKYVLAIDRTNWKLGDTHINVLFLAIIYNGTSFPILWATLKQSKKRGNSDTSERIALIKTFIKIFGIEKIDYIVGDREFIGNDWIQYLIDKNIKFRFRIKYNNLISRVQGGKSPARNFFRQLRHKEGIQLKGMRKVFGIDLYVTGMRLSNKEYLIIVSNDNASCEQILNDYKKRWGIECLFKALKSQGFDFETTHLTDPKKIDKLIALMAIACVWACKTGEWLNEEKEIAIKKHGRKAISVFRYGLDYLRGIFLHINENLSHLPIVFSFIQLPIYQFKIVLNC